MFIDRLINQGSARCWSRCSSSPRRATSLIAEDVVNVSTPGYQQKDLSLEKFQQMLAERRRAAAR